jgi:hypothetical protein
MTLEGFIKGYAVIVVLFMLGGGIFIEAQEWWRRRWR